MKSTKQKIIALTSASLLLAACGGGGGAGAPASNTSTATPNQAQQDFTPDASKLLADASDSSELYVESDFRFLGMRTTTLDISAVTDQGETITGARVSVYGLDGEIVEWNDELLDQSALIASGVIDTNGSFERLIELPQRMQTLLIEVNYPGIQNKALVAVGNDSTRYLFQALPETI